MRSSLIAFLCLTSLLNAYIQKEQTALAKFIKPVEISTASSGLDGIDCIYVINLDSRPDKWHRMKKLTKDCGLNVNRVSGVNGWGLTQADFKELCGPYPLRMPQGHIGCLLSHLSVLNDAYKRGLETIWVLEDDVEFAQDCKHIPQLLSDLTKADPDWDIFYTDPNSKNTNREVLISYAHHPRPDQEVFPVEHYLERTPISDDIEQIRRRFGTYSMIISKKGIQKILDYFTHVYLWETIDGDLHFIPGIKEYAARKDIVTVWPLEQFSNTEHPIKALPAHVPAQPLPLPFFADFLKPVELSEPDSGLPLVDCIYVINLDKRADKWATIQQKCTKHGLKVNRMSAVNGWDLPFEALEKLSGPHPIHMPKGHYGCLLSHLSVLQDAYQRGFDLIWVLEDDVEFIEAPTKLPTLINDLKHIDPDWDLFFTDINSKDVHGNPVQLTLLKSRKNVSLPSTEYFLQRTPISDEIMRIHGRYGMYSVFISKKGIKKILDYFAHAHVIEAIDGEIHIIPDIHEYSTRKDMVSVDLSELTSNTRTPVNITSSEVFALAEKLREEKKCACGEKMWKKSISPIITLATYNKSKACPPLSFVKNTTKHFMTIPRGQSLSIALHYTIAPREIINWATIFQAMLSPFPPPPRDLTLKSGFISGGFSWKTLFALITWAITPSVKKTAIRCWQIPLCPNISDSRFSPISPGSILISSTKIHKPLHKDKKNILLFKKSNTSAITFVPIFLTFQPGEARSEKTTS